jgi:geranylgeranyl diphosphate synthase type I
MGQARAPGRLASDALERYHAAIVAGLRRAVGKGAEPPYSLMRYHLGWEDAQGRPVEGRGGKLLRPALLLLCCQSAGGDWSSALPAAAAVELLHNFTLLHDDVEDASEQRHGRATVWRVWGQAEAINTGDGMFGLAHLTLLDLAACGHEAGRVLAAARLLDEATLELCAGQHRDLRYERQQQVGAADYLAMIEGKTAALLAAACAIGALLGGVDEVTVRHFHEFGRRLGLAFQIRDDVLGVWGDAAETGKSSGDDIRAGKQSYPIVFALERAPAEERKQLVAVLGRADASDEDLTATRELLEKLGARADGERVARDHAEAAIEALRGLSLGDERTELEALARFAAERSA